MRNFINSQKTRRAFFTLICILSLTTMSGHIINYPSWYSGGYFDQYPLDGDSLFSYVSEPIHSVGGPLSWVDSDRWGICLDRTNFPQMTDGQSYGILIAYGCTYGYYPSGWYDLGDQFEYYDGRLYYDGLGINNIVCDGPIPQSGNWDEADLQNMDWLLDWTKCCLFNDSYEWTFSSETSFAIRIYIR